MPTNPSDLFAQIDKVVGDPRVHDLAQVSFSLYSANLGWLKALAVLLTAGFIAATAFFIAKTGWLALRIDRFEDVILRSDIPKKRSIKAWSNVKRHFFDGDDNSLKIAIIEADNLLDEALKLAGLRGQTLGDKLKGATEANLPNLEDIWEAHKLRNRIAHESQLRLNRDTAEKALVIYEQAFKDLGVLE
ncbi:MAG: hypothetical protein AAB897_03970 [Patescibacteria group bacterium]